MMEVYSIPRDHAPKVSTKKANVRNVRKIERQNKIRKLAPSFKSFLDGTNIDKESKWQEKDTDRIGVDR